MASPRSTPLACRPGWDQLPPGRSEPEAYGQGPCAPWGRSRRVFWTGTRVASPKSPGEEVTLGRWAARRLDAASRHTCSPTATAMPTASAVKSPAPLAAAEVVERLLAQPQSGSAANPGQQRLTAAGAKRLGEISTRGGSREADSAVQDAADHDARPCSRCHAVGRQHGCTTGIASASIQCLIPPLSSLHPDVPPAGITRTCQQHLSETPCRASLLWPKQQTARGFQRSCRRPHGCEPVRNTGRGQRTRSSLSSGLCPRLGPGVKQKTGAGQPCSLPRSAAAASLPGYPGCDLRFRPGSGKPRAGLERFCGPTLPPAREAASSGCRPRVDHCSRSATMPHDK